MFVHGLFGHPEYTWRHGDFRSSWKSDNGSSASSTKEDTIRGNPEVLPSEAGQQGSASTSTKSKSAFWPRDLLPKLIPNTRIYTWGYEADIHKFGSSTSQNTIHQYSSSLLSDLADLQESCSDQSTPIIFVVHSLGGIIVKDAVNQSLQTEGTRLKGIAPTVHAICFLGTPHRGSKTASIGKVAYQVSVAATRRPNLKLLEGLKRNSETLDRISDSFRQTLLKQDIKIYSFREEKETRKYVFFSTIVVDSESAKFGDGKEEVGSIPDKHSGMTKFEDASSIGFKRVSAQLKRWVQELHPNSST